VSIRSLTQEDPIGLAGGLNLYGFAGGDPVTFSDPFGLCPSQMPKGTICLDFFIERKSVMGFRGDGRTFDRNAPPDASRMQVLIFPNHKVTLNASQSCGPTGCHDPSSRNSAQLTEGSNGSFSVAVKGVNSAAWGAAPSVDATITFTPDGSGGFTTHGSRNQMPSLGMYESTGRGWDVIKGGERPEHGGALEGVYLYDFTRQDRW
jgi:hypothetical protein